MRPCHQLGKLGRAAEGRLSRLRGVAAMLSMPADASADRSSAWLAVESLNLWAGFVRSYYLSGAIRSRTRSGSPVFFVAVTFPDARAAIKHAVLQAGRAIKKPAPSRIDEPPWHNKRVVLPLFANVGASNLAQIQAAFSIPATFMDYLPAVRNFYAHRCDETYAKAAGVAVKLGLSTIPRLRPTEIMCSAMPTRPQNVITDWLDEMTAVVSHMCA